MSRITSFTRSLPPSPESRFPRKEAPRRGPWFGSLPIGPTSDIWSILSSVPYCNFSLPPEDNSMVYYMELAFPSAEISSSEGQSTPPFSPVRRVFG